MASCVSTRTNMAAQTPIFDRIFLEDFHYLDSAFMGRHLTEVWNQGEGDTQYIDRVTIGQPNLNNRWQRINAAECAVPGACCTPRQYVSAGSQRTLRYMEKMDLSTQLFCNTQLRYGTRTCEQMELWYKGFKKIPEDFTNDFIRVHATDMNTVGVQIASSNLLDLGTNVFVPDITPDATNIAGQLTEIELGSAGLLPTSALTFPLLDYYAATIEMNGYHRLESNLPQGLFNLLTDMRTWARLTNGNPSMKDMMAFTNPQQASALYTIGHGIKTPFGNFTPTFDDSPARFQHIGGGRLERVFPFYNVTSDTGYRRVTNPAYVNARYQISYIWHPRAIKIFTPEFKKCHPLVPTVNSAMYGKWVMIGNEGSVLIYRNPDGTETTLNNDKNENFYWLSAMELGFEYVEPDKIVPILHLVDGSGKDSVVDDAVCGTAPAYTAQSTLFNPIVC